MKAVKTEKKKQGVTRAQAERALANGADPVLFKTHPNYHVRSKAWKKDGRRLGTDPAEAARFLETIKVKLPREEWAARFPLTDAELQQLEAATSEAAWNDTCDAVKKLRAGAYPADWFSKVVESGLSGKKSAAFREAIPKEVFDEQVAISNEMVAEVIAEETTANTGAST